MLSLLLACASPLEPTLPPTAQMAPDRLAIVMHGYISSGDEIDALVDEWRREAFV